MRYIAVLDIGKTNAKLILVDLHKRSEIGVKTTPNLVVNQAPYPHHDLDALWQFFKDALREFSNQWPIDAINISSHGASVVLLDKDGEMATPMLDYEYDGIDQTCEEYDAIRPDFSETGSPRLAAGLNIGAQLFWLFKSFPDLKAKTDTILTYPQYWSYRLSGVKACEVTSLGCHSDLWNPTNYCYSSLVENLALEQKMPAVKKAGDAIGTLLPDLADQLGILPQTPIYCGIHDSNASLVPHLLSREGAFSVVSTGTWVISMAMNGKVDTLDPERDTLINVNAFGSPVASSRFMGGREFELLMGEYDQSYCDDDLEHVLDETIAYYPSRISHCGPFNGRNGYWSVDEKSLSDGQRMVAVSYYLALMTSVSLSMVANSGDIIVEGPFAKNALYLSMLATIMDEDIYIARQNLTGTAIGAALLTQCPENLEDTLMSGYQKVENELNTFLKLYAQAWFDIVDKVKV